MNEKDKELLDNFVDWEPGLFRDAAMSIAAPDLHRIATELAAENKRLRDQVNKIDRDRRLVEAQVDRLLAMVNSMDDDYVRDANL